MELFPSAHFVSAGGQDHAGQNVVPAGQLFYPERCDGESRRAGHRAGCRRQDRAALYRRAAGLRQAAGGHGQPPVRAAHSRAGNGGAYLCFQTLSDASALAEALRPESRVLILGAGLTGVKCAEGIRGLCAQIAIADLAPRVLPAVLDDTAAAMVQARMEEKGVRFYLNDSAAAFRGNTARLQSGTELEFDVLVTAVGVRPNTQLVADAGGAVDRGILVDGRCATTLPDVYAAGDCAQGYDAVSGEKRMLPLWPNAVLQGETAGINMAGGRADYTQGIALNASGVFGLHMVTAGSYEGESFTVQRDGSYKRLVTADGVLKGVIMVGDVSRAGIYTDLIRKKKPLSEIDFDLIRESPQLMAFSQKDRRVQLGGEV